jgi:hypothetical protein
MMFILRVKNHRFLLQLITLTILSVPASSQSKKEMKEIFKQAETHYLYEEYDLANQLYILLENPENLNILYKIGTCYLNIPDEKEKAIPYLEAAVKNTSYEANVKSFKEKRAPLDTYFYLAKAYMINNELDKSLNTFRTFKNLTRKAEKKGGMENLEFVDQQIQACNNAIRYLRNPSMITNILLGADFSQGSMNERPVISFDGTTLVYTEERGMVNVILFSKKIRDQWQPPVEITDQLGAGEDCSSCSLNRDGTELYLYKNDNFDGNIYSSRYSYGKWSRIEKLNKNINTRFYESHASVTSDGKRLYFTSNREGGQGGLDIYMSETDASGDWGMPVNLGANVNTPYNEDNPFVTVNDSLLYFCSEGHSSMGGFDNFKSRKTSYGWGTPQNMGIPVNSTDDDKFFQPINNGMNAIYSMKTDYKKREIFYLGLGGMNVNKIYKIEGNLWLNDAALAPNKNYYILILNRVSGETLYRTSPEKPSGSYAIDVGPGDFRIIYSGDEYFPRSIDTAIRSNNPAKVISLDVTLVRDSSLIASEYNRINLAGIPGVAAVDSSILIRNLNVLNVTDGPEDEQDVLYYTVQVMALYNPVDASYFRYITDMKVMYNERDRFYRYTSGQFKTREEARALRLELIRKGYPDEIFIKKVLR